MLLASVLLASCSFETVNNVSPEKSEADVVTKANQPASEQPIKAATVEDPAKSNVPPNISENVTDAVPENISQPDATKAVAEKDDNDGDLIDTVGFILPSGNIYCRTYDEILRCAISSLLNPMPPQPETCDLDWGSGVVLYQDTAPEVLCAGDTIAGNYDTLAYGNIWRNGAFECKSETVGLTCRNSTEQGFFLSRERWEFF
ncbi:MAG: DUF6636 domain-containing protein [Cyanobacteria bacterium P01_F01_bin.150]